MLQCLRVGGVRPQATIGHLGQDGAKVCIMVLKCRHLTSAIELLSRAACVPAEAISGASRIDSFATDSLLIEILAFELEENLDIDICREELMTFKTVIDLANFLQRCETIARMRPKLRRAAR